MASRVTEYCEQDVIEQDLAHKLISKANIRVNCSGVNNSEYRDLGEYENNRITEFDALHHHWFPDEFRRQLNKSQSNLAMGLLPPIGRAWMSVDSDLFFWNFDTNEDLAYFDGLQETILKVEIVPPRVDIIDPQIHYIIVVVTSVEIVLLGMGFNNSVDGRPVPRTAAEVDYKNFALTVLAEPLFSTPLEATGVQDIASTADGRIFLAAQDSLFEVVYQAAGWFRGKKCEKHNLSKNFLVNLVPAIGYFSSTEDIRQISVDESRHFVYTLGEHGSITFYDLGEKGDGVSKVKTFSLEEIQREIKVSCGVEEDFLVNIINIRAVPSTKSQTITLEATTSKALRIYFSSYEQAFSTFAVEQRNARPYMLRVVHVRYPPNNLFGVRRGVTIYNALSLDEALVVGQMENDDVTTLTMLSSSNFQFTQIPIEYVTVHQFNGSVWAMACLPEPDSAFTPPGYVPYLRGPWVTCQHLIQTKKVYVLSSEGVYIFQYNSPLELFRRFLSQFDSDSKQFKKFIQSLGLIETCIMALIVMASDHPNDIALQATALRVFADYGGEASSVSQQELENSIYSPIMDQSLANFSTMAASPLRTSTPVRIASPLQTSTVLQEDTVTEHIAPSNRHEAMYTYFARIVSSIWSQPICKRVDGIMRNMLPMAKVRDAAYLLGCFIKAIDENNLIEFSHDNRYIEHTSLKAVEKERASLAQLRELLAYTYELLNLWQILDEHEFAVITQLLPDDFLTGLGTLTFSECANRCRDIASELVTCLIKHYIGDEATTAMLSQRLSEECPSLFTAQDAHLLKASEHIVSARHLPFGHDRNSVIRQGVEIIRRCIQRVNMALVSDLLQDVYAYDAIVDLALERAEKEDATKLAVIAYKQNLEHVEPRVREAISRREAAYKFIVDVLDLLHDRISKNTPIDQVTVAQLTIQRDNIINSILASDDELAHVQLFQWLYKHNMIDILFEKPQKFFEQYLFHELENGAGEQYLVLLWKYYEKNGNYVSAAKLLLKFVENSPRVPLNSRLTYLSHAIMCIQSAPETRANQELKQRIQEFLDVAQVQQMTRDEIERYCDENTAQQALQNLDSKLYSLTDLYSEFAVPMNLPKVKLAILKCANHYDAEAVESIWSEILKIDLAGLDRQPAENVDNVRMKISDTLSKLYRTYASSNDFVPLPYILRELLLRSFQVGRPSWVVTICKDCGIPIAAAVHVASAEFRSDPFWSQRKHWEFIAEFAKNVFQDFVASHRSMGMNERLVLKEKCLSFIAALLLSIDNATAALPLVDELKFFDEEIKRIL